MTQSVSNLRTVWERIPAMVVKKNQNYWELDANMMSEWMSLSVLLLPSKTSTGAGNVSKRSAKTI